MYVVAGTGSIQKIDQGWRAPNNIMRNRESVESRNNGYTNQSNK